MGKGARNRKIRQHAYSVDPEHSKSLARFLRKKLRQARRNNVPK